MIITTQPLVFVAHRLSVVFCYIPITFNCTLERIRKYLGRVKGKPKILGNNNKKLI